MNLFVGANASGKSNFLDLLRVLQGIGNGFTIGEILDGKPRSATSAVWDGIRGGSRLACFAAAGEDRGHGDVTIEVHGRFGGGPVRRWLGMEERECGRPAGNELGASDRVFAVGGLCDPRALQGRQDPLRHR